MRLNCAIVAVCLVVLAACDDSQTSNPNPPPTNPPAKPVAKTPSKAVDVPVDPPAPMVKLTTLSGADAEAAAKGEVRAGSVYVDIADRQITLNDKTTNAEALAVELKKIVKEKSLTKLTVRVAKGSKPIYLKMVQASAGDAGLKEIEVVHVDPTTKAVIEPPK